MTDTIGAAPETRHLSFLALLFGAGAAPIFWLGQLMLGYWVTALACYPGDHPVPLTSTGSLFNLLIGFDVVAAVAAACGGLVALWCLGKARRGGGVEKHIRYGRVQFLALWGIFSSLWFFCAILFSTIASVTVPLCAQ